MGQEVLHGSTRPRRAGARVCDVGGENTSVGDFTERAGLAGLGSRYLAELPASDRIQTDAVDMDQIGTIAVQWQSAISKGYLVH